MWTALFALVSLVFGWTTSIDAGGSITNMRNDRQLPRAEQRLPESTLPGLSIRADFASIFTDQRESHDLLSASDSISNTLAGPPVQGVSTGPSPPALTGASTTPPPRHMTDASTLELGMEPRPTPTPFAHDGWIMTAEDEFKIRTTILPLLDGSNLLLNGSSQACAPLRFEPESDVWWFAETDRGGGTPVQELTRHLLYHHGFATYIAAQTAGFQEAVEAQMLRGSLRAGKLMEWVVEQMRQLPAVQQLRAALEDLTLGGLRNLHSYDHAGRWGSTWNDPTVYDFQAGHCDQVLRLMRLVVRPDRWSPPEPGAPIPGIRNRTFFEDAFLRPTTAGGDWQISRASIDDLCNLRFTLHWYNLPQLPLDDMRQDLHDNALGRYMSSNRRRNENRTGTRYGINQDIQSTEYDVSAMKVKPRYWWDIFRPVTSDEEYCCVPALVQNCSEGLNKTEYISQWYDETLRVYRKYQESLEPLRSTDEFVDFGRCASVVAAGEGLPLNWTRDELTGFSTTSTPSPVPDPRFQRNPWDD